MARAYAQPAPLTDKEYKAELEIVANEVYEANYFNQTNEAMNDLLLNDERVFVATGRYPEFWQAHKSATQVALFMSLWRIFDTKNDDAKGIHTLLRITTANLHLFAKSVLAVRKMAGENTKPPWFDNFLKAAWEPTSARCLKPLKDALKPHAKLFEEVYGPIRHNIYGHRLMSDLRAGAELFPQTNRKALGEMIHFLQNLVSDLQHLYNHGNKPTLKGDFSSGNENIRQKVREVVQCYVAGAIDSE
jgi:AbiU2